MKTLIYAIGALRDTCGIAGLSEEMLPVVTLTFPNAMARNRFITTVKMEAGVADIFDANRRMFLRDGIDMRIEGVDVRVNDRVSAEAMIRSKFL